MLTLTSLSANTVNGRATAVTTQLSAPVDLGSLRAERAAAEAAKLDLMAQAEGARTQSAAQKGPSAYHAARLEHLQKALTRLLGGTWSGPAVIAVGSRASAEAVAAEGALVDGIATGDGADAVTVTANTAANISTDDDGGNFGRTRYFANADALAITARHVDGVHSGGGDDAIAITGGAVAGVHAGDGADRVAVSATMAGGIHGEGGDDDITITAETGMFREVEPETDYARAMVASWAETGAEGRMLRARYASGASGGAGDDRITAGVTDAYALAGGTGDDRITASGGTFALHYTAGDGQDMMHLRDGAEAVVMLDASLTDDWTVERGPDSLTLRFGTGQSITFAGFAGAGAIGVTRIDRETVTMIHSPPALDAKA